MENDSHRQRAVSPLSPKSQSHILNLLEIILWDGVSRHHLLNKFYQSPIKAAVLAFLFPLYCSSRLNGSPTFVHTLIAGKCERLPYLENGSLQVSLTTLRGRDHPGLSRQP